MRSRKTSIAVIVIIALVTVTTVALSTLGVLHYVSARSRELENVRAALVLDADQIAPSLALPMWNFDRPQLDKVVEGMMRDPILQSIVVKSADNKTVICARERDAQGGIQAVNEESSTAGLLVEKRDITFASETLATVTLFGTTKSVEGKIKDILTWTIFNIVSLDLVLIFALYMLLRCCVFKPLREVEAYAAEVSTGRGEDGPNLEGTQFRGELEDLRNSLEKMLSLLKARYAELRASEEKFSKAFQANPSGIIITEIETGCFVEVNESFCRRYGYSPQELVGHTGLDLGIWKSPEHRNLLLDPLRADGSLRDLEMRTHTRDGGIRTVLVNAEFIEFGGKRRILSLIHDITERKRAEEALREKQAQLILAMDIARLAHWEFDVAKNLVTGDENIFQLFGTTSAKEGGLSMSPEEYIRKFVHPLDAGLVASEVALGAATTDPNFARQFEHRMIRADGSEGVMMVRCRIIKGAAGQTVKISGTNQDITERKRSEERIRRLVESNVQGVIFWNMRGEITEANDAFLKIVGYTREDIATGAVNWILMTPREYAAQDEDALRELAATGICKPHEKEYVRKDGSRVPVLIGGAMLGEGSDEGVSFVLDLTERKKLEQQFLRSQRMESIGTLAGGVAHDLNNVLSPIMMSLAVLKMKFPDPDSQELLDMLSTSAQRGADMVRQVLSFARGVESRRMELQIRHLVQEIQKIATDTFHKNIEISTSVPNDLWTVHGDPTQLHQVLLNLSVNARDAMPNGGTLTISAENVTLDAQYAALNLEAKAGPYVLLQVEDSGTGMLAEVIEKIFDPFFTTKEIGKGTGLGLSTSLGIIKNHGGFIQVYSEPGKGTKFKVYLPAQAGASAGTAAKVAAEMPCGNGELILVVDDENTVRQITQQTLEAFGYRVVLASDGGEALTIYADRRAEIAVVLTDMMMPGLDGPTTIQVLRKMNPAARIIAVSGLSANNTASTLGVKHFLPKPYTAETLLKTLREVLSGEG